MDAKTYKAKTFDLNDLRGISNQTLEMHFKLYEGYVKNTNSLNDAIAELARLPSISRAQVDYDNAPFGVQYWGMRWTCES